MSTLDNPNVTETTDLPIRPNAVRFGLITGLILIAVSLVFQVTGLSDPANASASAGWISGLVSFAVLAGGLIWAMNQQKQDQGGYLTFGKGLTVAILAALIIGLISAVWMVINFTLVQPDMIETMQEAAKEQMYQRNPNLTDSEIEQAMGFMGVMFNPWVLAVSAIFTTLIQGLIIGLIGSAILKNNPPETA
ncbi:MAG TPA: DUF4199 domain-containing protein [Saprospiraceae bacterium]|nr:DUF4199 domain-containing protein [Saprospiraceae bacterium]